MDNSMLIQELVSAKKQTILSSVKNFVVDDIKKLTIDFDVAFIKYLKEAYEKYSKVKTLLFKNEPRDLYDFYVGNNVIIDNTEVDCSTAYNLLKKSHFNIILGSGGTGKSILLKHFFISEIKRKDLIPLLFELRTYSGGSLETFLYTALKNLGFLWDEKYFQYALKSGAFLLLLDGYDEIGDSKKREFYLELEKICDRYSHNWYIMSSRQVESFIGWQRFSVFKLMPLSKNQAISLVNKLNYDLDIKNKFIENIDNLYTKHKSFVSNPLLLNIMLMTYDNFAEIPEKRHVFYSNAFDTLYSIHDATKGGFKRDLKSNLSSDIFKKIFSEFCFVSYLQGKIEFSPDTLFEILSCGKKYSNNFDAEAYINDLQNAVCLIYQEGNVFLFSHRSFQEYFTAIYILNLNDKQQFQVCRHLLDNKGPTADSDSVFEMLMDMNQARFEANFMVPILKELESTLPNSYENDLQRYFVGYVDSLEILTRKGFLELPDVETGDWNYIYVMHFQKNILFCVVKFKNPICPHILNFINSHYTKENIDYRAPKIASSYLQRFYSMDELRKDRSLFEKVLQSPLGQLIKGSVGILSEIEKRQKDERNSFLTLLESYQNE